MKNEKRTEIRYLAAMGITKVRIARQTGVGTRTVFRVLAEAV